MVAHNKLLTVSNDRKTVQVALGGDMQGTEPELCWVDAHKRFEQRYPMQERSSLIDGAVLCAHCESMLRLGVGSCPGYCRGTPPGVVNSHTDSHGYLLVPCGLRTH